MPSFRFNLLTLFRTQIDKHCACIADSQDMESAPPPLPPKDAYRFRSYDTTTTCRNKPLPVRGTTLSCDRLVATPPPPVVYTQSASHAPSSIVPVYHRRRLRSEPPEAYEVIDTAQEEVQRQARLKLEKKTALLQQAVEEEQRRQALEAELQYAAMIRTQKEAQERAIEEEKQRELEARRRAEKEKRMAEARRLQEWRDQQAKRVEAAAAGKAASRKRRDEERRGRILSSDAGSGVRQQIVSGWVTLQSTESITSRRRYCRVQGHALQFFKDALAVSPIMETIEASRIVKVSDNEEEFHGLESLRHAFGLQTRDHTSFIIIPEVKQHLEDFITAIIQLAGL